jgi:enediyne biosynthesis protein E4
MLPDQFIETLRTKRRIGSCRRLRGARLDASGLCLALILTVAGFLRAQQSPDARVVSPQAGAVSQKPSTQPAAAGGMSNAGPHAASFDDMHRPITAGGFVKTGPIVFQDIAAAAGLTNWRHKAGTPAKRVILEAKGPGVCLLDYDNDGWLDIYLVNGSTYDAMDGKAAPRHAALFHNNHDGTFTDVMYRWRLRQ